MNDSETLSDLEEESPPKLTFEEVKTQFFKEPGLIKQKKDLLKAMHFYCNDQKKHSRIIKFLYWPLVVSFIQEQNNNKLSLFGLRLLNLLIKNEATHEQILQMGQDTRIGQETSIMQEKLRETHLVGETADTAEERKQWIEAEKEKIRKA
jgi:hypothetical protein